MSNEGQRRLMGDELVTIGAAAARYGLATSTLRWWERQGLLEPAERRGGQRRYGPAELRRIGLIHLARNTGLMSLNQIAELLAGAAGRHWHDTVRDRIRDLDQQIERLITARETLTHTLRCPAGHPTQCRHLDDVLSQVNSRQPLGPTHTHDEFRHHASDETSAATGPTATGTSRCKACERPLRQAGTGRPRSYCSRACRQHAYRARTRGRSGSPGGPCT